MGDEIEEEVNLWPAALCRECGRAFPKDQDWAKMCFLCWKESKGYEFTKGDKCFLWTQIEMARVVEEATLLQHKYRRLLADSGKGRKAEVAVSGLDARLLREVISLCHPDKHGDSEKATAVTQKLLALRAEMKQKK